MQKKQGVFVIQMSIPVLPQDALSGTSSDTRARHNM